jgi:hypothetical protein
MAREGAAGGLIALLRRIATAVEVLPEVRDHLDKLDVHVSEMSAEVTRMREGVDALTVKVDNLNEGVDGLDGHFDGLRGEIRGLDGHLGEVRRLLQPLQALGGLGRIGDRIRGG